MKHEEVSGGVPEMWVSRQNAFRERWLFVYADGGAGGPRSGLPGDGGVEEWVAACPALVRGIAEPSKATAKARGPARVMAAARARR